MRDGFWSGFRRFDRFTSRLHRCWLARLGNNGRRDCSGRRHRLDRFDRLDRGLRFRHLDLLGGLRELGYVGSGLFSRRGLGSLDLGLCGFVARLGHLRLSRWLGLGLGLRFGGSVLRGRLVQGLVLNRATRLPAVIEQPSHQARRTRDQPRSPLVLSNQCGTVMHALAHILDGLVLGGLTQNRQSFGKSFGYLHSALPH